MTSGRLLCPQTNNKQQKSRRCCLVQLNPDLQARSTDALMSPPSLALVRGTIGVRLTSLYNQLLLVEGAIVVGDVTRTACSLTEQRRYYTCTCRCL